LQVDHLRLAVLMVALSGPACVDSVYMCEKGLGVAGRLRTVTSSPFSGRRPMLLKEQSWPSFFENTPSSCGFLTGRQCTVQTNALKKLLHRCHQHDFRNSEECSPAPMILSWLSRRLSRPTRIAMLKWKNHGYPSHVVKRNPREAIT
jgi:hypothetical protein